MSNGFGVRNLNTFSIERGVGNITKDKNLRFIRSLSEQAKHSGVSLHATLGMSAIELVRKGEMLDITEQYPSLTAENVESGIMWLASRRATGFGKHKTFFVGEPKVYSPVNEPQWIGAAVLDRQATLENERHTVARLLSDLAEEDVDLVPVEFFLNIGIIDRSSAGIDEVLGYIERQLPQTVDVYEVDVRRGRLMIPQ